MFLEKRKQRDLLYNLIVKNLVVCPTSLSFENIEIILETSIRLSRHNCFVENICIHVRTERLERFPNVSCANIHASSSSIINVSPFSR